MGHLLEVTRQNLGFGSYEAEFRIGSYEAQNWKLGGRVPHKFQILGSFLT